MDNVFLSDTRVYIAGILFPTIDVSVTNIAGQVPTASITVPADARLFNVGDNDRVPVLIFQKESMVGSSRYIMLFEGFIASRVYMNTAIQRTITFQATSIMDILNDMRLLYMHSLDDLYRQMTPGNNEKAVPNGNTYFTTQYFFQHGLNPGGNPICFPYEYLENVLAFMGEPQSGEGNVAKEHCSNLASYFWNMHKLYKMQDRFLRVPLYDENNGKSIWGGNNPNGFPILRGLQQSKSMDLLSPFVATQTPSSQTAMGLLEMVATPMDFEISTPSSPAFINNHIGSILLKPNFCDSLPPMCNVMFRSQVREISQNTLYKGTPTRIQVHDVNSPDSWMRKQAGDDMQKYFEMMLTLFYPQRDVPEETVINKAYNNYATTILDTEKYTGPWVHEVNTPEWWHWTEIIKHTNEDTSEEGRRTAWISMRQLLLHRQLVLARYMNRTLSVQMAFNPYIAVGYPGVVFDAEDTGLSFAGYVVGVSHVISATGMETTVQLAFVRTLHEAAYVKITHPLADLQELLSNKDAMTRIYEGLLGNREAEEAKNLPVASPASSVETYEISQNANDNPTGNASTLIAHARRRANEPGARYVLGARTLKQPKVYDCSYFVQCCLQDMGYNFKTDLWTGNMRTELPKKGIPYHTGLDGLKPGDILYYPAGHNGHKYGHTEIYTGGNVSVGAHSTDSGVSERGYRSNIPQYVGYFRVPDNTVATSANDTTVTPIADTGTVTASNGAQSTNDATTQTATVTDEKAVADEQAKQEEARQKALASTKAGEHVLENSFNTSNPNLFNGAEARTFKELFDEYTQGSEDRRNPQRNPSQAYLLQRRNICSLDDFCTFADLTKEIGKGPAGEDIPLSLSGAYMINRNTLKVYEKSLVMDAAENTDAVRKQSAESNAAEQTGEATVAATVEDKEVESLKAEVQQAQAAETAGTGTVQATVTPQETTRGTGDDLGILSRKYESRGKSEAVGYDTTGGTSYGKYQIASFVKPGAKGSTMTTFLSWCERNGGENGKEVARRMRAAGPLDTGSQSGAAVNEWKKLVSEGKMGTMEHDFIKATHYDVTMSKLNPGARDFVSQYKTLQDTVWSTANGHGAGGAAKIINKIYTPGMTEEQFIEALYNDRPTHYGNSTQKVQASMYRRYANEKSDALSMIKQEKETGSRAIPNDFSGSYSGGASSGGTTVSGTIGQPVRSKLPQGDYTYTEILAGDSNFTINMAEKNVCDVLKAVAKDAFAKQTYA